MAQCRFAGRKILKGGPIPRSCIEEACAVNVVIQCLSGARNVVFPIDCYNGRLELYSNGTSARPSRIKLSSHQKKRYIISGGGAKAEPTCYKWRLWPFGGKGRYVVNKQNKRINVFEVGEVSAPRLKYASRSRYSGSSRTATLRKLWRRVKEFFYSKENRYAVNEANSPIENEATAALVRDAVAVLRAAVRGAQHGVDELNQRKHLLNKRSQELLDEAQQRLDSAYQMMEGTTVLESAQCKLILDNLKYIYDEVIQANARVRMISHQFNALRPTRIAEETTRLTKLAAQQ